MRKNSCSVCGEPCRGKTCRKCVSANAKPKYDKCIECGAPVKPKLKESRCKSCGRKETARKLSFDNPTTSTCQYCGKEIPWTIYHRYSKYITCSRSCMAKLSEKPDRVHNYDEVVGKIKSLIAEQGRYVTRSEIREKLKISDKVFTRLGISPNNLNEEMGYYFHQEAHDINNRIEELLSGGTIKSVDDLEEKLGCEIPANYPITAKFKQYGLEELRPRDPDEFKASVISLIKSKGHQMSIRSILDELHVDFKSTWVKFGCDIDDLHDAAGVCRLVDSSYHEGAALNAIRSKYADAISQQSFDDLRSVKGRRLYFDIYIPSKSVLVEVDGEQHYDRNHMMYSPSLEANDRLKDEYAVKAGLKLFRLPVSPVSTFSRRLLELIDMIEVFDKESELREPQQLELF